MSLKPLNLKDRENISRIITDGRNPDINISSKAFEDWCSYITVQEKGPNNVGKRKFFSSDMWFYEQKNFNESRTGRDIVVKSRQIGMTTLESARNVFFALCNPGTITLVVSHVDSISSLLLLGMMEIYDSFAKRCLECGLSEQFPEMNKPTEINNLGSKQKRKHQEQVLKWSQDSMLVSLLLGTNALDETYLLDNQEKNIKTKAGNRTLWFSNGSRIIVKTAGHSPVGASSIRGFTAQRAHLTEIGYYAYPDLSYEAIYPLIRGAKEIIIESTPCGPNYFYNLVMKNLDEDSREYKVHFWPFWKHDAYSKTTQTITTNVSMEISSVDETEKKIKDEIFKTEGNNFDKYLSGAIGFYRETAKNFSSSERFLREYPISITTAFSQMSRQLFSTELINKLSSLVYKKDESHIKKTKTSNLIANINEICEDIDSLVLDINWNLFEKLDSFIPPRSKTHILAGKASSSEENIIFCSSQENVNGLETNIGNGTISSLVGINNKKVSGFENTSKWISKNPTNTSNNKQSIGSNSLNNHKVGAMNIWRQCYIGIDASNGIGRDATAMVCLSETGDVIMSMSSQTASMRNFADMLAMLLLNLPGEIPGAENDRWHWNIIIENAAGGGALLEALKTNLSFPNKFMFEGKGRRISYSLYGNDRTWADSSGVSGLWRTSAQSKLAMVKNLLSGELVSLAKTCRVTQEQIIDECKNIIIQESSGGSSIKIGALNKGQGGHLRDDMFIAICLAMWYANLEALARQQIML